MELVNRTSAYKSSLSCLGENVLHESGLSDYFLKNIFFTGGHFYVTLYRTILETSSSFRSFLLVQVKELARRNYVPWSTWTVNTAANC